jgi:hypothetical protein
MAVAGGLESDGLVLNVFTVCYFCIPMFTFYMTNYWIFIDYMNVVLHVIERLDGEQERVTIPLAWGLEVSFGLSILLFAA